MPTDAQKQGVSDAISNIRNAQIALSIQGRQLNDNAIVAKIATEYQVLDTALSQLLQAQMVTDDAVFAQAKTQLNKEAGSLQIQAAAIAGIVSDAKLAAEIAGYIALAAGALERI